LANFFGGYFDLQNRKVIGDPGRAYKSLSEGGDSGFSAILGSWRHSSGHFGRLGKSSHFWCSTEKDRHSVWVFYFFSYDGKLYRAAKPKTHGFSCRCIQI